MAMMVSDERQGDSGNIVRHNVTGGVIHGLNPHSTSTPPLPVRSAVVPLDLASRLF